MVYVSCFGVRFSVMFHFMFVHYTFSSVLVAEWPFVLIVFCLFVIFIYFPFGFESGICLLVVLVPVHCFSAIILTRTNKETSCALLFLVTPYDNSTNSRDVLLPV